MESEGWEHRAARIWLPVAFAGLSLVYCSALVRAPHNNWNAARGVGPPVAIASGYDLYATRNAGAVLGTLYGPMKEILYLPASLGRTPTEAIMIAGILNFFAILGPLLFIQLLDPSSRPRRLALASFVAAAGAILLNPSLRHMAVTIHVDAPTVGMGLLSCALLMTPGRLGSGRLAAAALLSVLTIWTKQIEAPLALSQGLYLGLVYGWRVAGSFVCWFGAAAVITGIVFIALFGFDGMLFTTVTLPASLTQGAEISERFLSLSDLLISSSPFLLIVLLAVRAFHKRQQGSGFLEVIRQRPWMLLVLVAVFLIPTSVAGRTFTGGNLNSYHSLYFLMAAASLILTRSEITPGQPRPGARIAYSVAAVVVFATLPQLNLESFRDVRDNPQEQAYRFALAHPGTAYFPWHPLSTLMAEGRLDHFDRSVNDRRLAGYPMTQEHFDRHVPPDFSYVMFDKSVYDQGVLSYLPNYSRTVTLEEMPGWIAYVREDAPP